MGEKHKPLTVACAGIYRTLCTEIDVEIVNHVHQVGLSMQSSIVRKLGISQSSVSKHLSELVKVEILLKDKIGRTVVYRINKKVFIMLEQAMSIFAK